MDYYTTAKADRTKTKNNQEVCKVFRALGFSDSWVDTNEDTLIVCGYDAYADLEDCTVIFLPDGTVDAYEYSPYTDDDYSDEEYKDCKRVPFIEYLQDMLLPDYYFLLKFIGNEGLRYIDAWAMYVNKNICKHFDFRQMIENELKKD